MTEEFSCDNTQEMLDRLTAGTLGEGELSALREHARACPDCAMLVRIHEHCASLAEDSLEAAVPEGMADGVRRGVLARIAERAARSIPGDRTCTAPVRERDAAAAIPQEGAAKAAPAPTGRPWSGRWRRGLVPGLAAAVFVLAFACGFLVGELRQMRQREEVLIAELAESRRALDRYGVRETAAPHARPAGALTGLGRRYVLPQRDSFSVGELVTLLEQLPPRTSILPSGGDLTVLGGAIPSEDIERCTSRERVDMRDGLQAGEAVLLARCLRIDPGARVSREELVAIIETIIQKGARS